MTAKYYLSIAVPKQIYVCLWNTEPLATTNNKQANTENCGPLHSNKFDLKKGQRSRSRHGANWKGLSQGPCMPNTNALSLILQKIWARLKFLWQTDGRTDRGMDGQTDEWVLMSPAFPLPSFIKIHQAVLENLLKMWKFTDGRTTDFDSGELKTQLSLAQRSSKCRMVIDLGVIWEDIIGWVWVTKSGSPSPSPSRRKAELRM